MTLIRNMVFFLLLTLFAAPSKSQGYDIKIQVNGLSDSTVILGHYLSKSMYPDDTVKLDKKGAAVFNGNKKLPEGIYIILLPNSSYFEIIMGADQSYSIEVGSSNFLQSLDIKGSDENQIFLDFQRFMVTLRNQADSLTKMIKNENNVDIKNKLSEDLKKVNEDRISRINKINNEYPHLFVSTFLNATLDIAVPDPPKDENGKVIDPNWQYYYYRSHYFDNFDISDPRLLRTPLYEDKIMNYLTKVIPQIPDTLIPQVDYCIDKSRADSSLFRFMLITLFNYYAKSNLMGMDAVQVHIAEKYYLHDSWWSDEKFITDLKERVDKTKPLLIGEVAPDIELMSVPSQHFKSAKTDSAMKSNPHVGTKITLHDINAKYLVLLFWEADCGHCKTAVPELYKIYTNTLQNLNVKVLAVSTLFGEDGKIKWVDFVNEKGLYNWINAWNPYSYDFKLKYDVISTPQIYILDENKKIIAKRISPEQVEEIITSFMK
jgi:alkyl hydroperoxide reductase subunit AhpC